MLFTMFIYIYGTNYIQFDIVYCVKLLHTSINKYKFMNSNVYGMILLLCYYYFRIHNEINKMGFKCISEQRLVVKHLAITEVTTYAILTF